MKDQWLSTRRVALALMGMLLISLSLWQIVGARHGLQITRFQVEGLPVTVLSPTGVDPSTRPLILVGHGFSGSEEIMRGFALTLAHSGYAVASWDFDGHGSNLRPLTDASLEDNPRQVRQALLARRMTDNQRVAIVGHSMGSRAAIQFGVTYPEVMAVAAISPVSGPVTPSLPQNLLLIAGTLEPRFLLNAQMLLAQAGGEGGDPTLGDARSMKPIPGVEHISILYAPAAHQAVLEWLNKTFGTQPGARPYHDRRILWYVVGILGTLLLLNTLAPGKLDSLEQKPASLSGSITQNNVPSPARITKQVKPAQTFNPIRLVVSLLAGALTATIGLWGLSLAGLELDNLLGIAVGGYLLLWFGVAGIVAGLLVRLPFVRPGRSALFRAGIIFMALWFGFGWLGGMVWVNWTLWGLRLLLWPLGVVLLIPWLMVIGEAIRRVSWPGKIAWWLGHSIILVVAFYSAIMLNPELYFISIILPLLPVVIGIHMIGVGGQKMRWIYAISGAGLISWLILAVFPIVNG